MEKSLCDQLLRVCSAGDKNTCEEAAKALYNTIKV